MPLLEVEDCALVVIDCQVDFYRDRADVDEGALKLMWDRAGWVVQVAVALDVPVVVTEEDPATNGGTAPVIADHLPEGTPVITKPVFGLAAVPEILAAVVATGRRHVVLVGMETDVCVAHSALGLLDEGFAVAVVGDTTYSPAEAHAHGLERLRGVGVPLLSAKGVCYEWVRTLEATMQLVEAHPELRDPPAFHL
jgi:nicotinamidase-related amidase